MAHEDQFDLAHFPGSQVNGHVFRAARSTCVGMGGCRGEPGSGAQQLDPEATVGIGRDRLLVGSVEAGQRPGSSTEEDDHGAGDDVAGCVHDASGKHRAAIQLDLEHVVRGGLHTLHVGGGVAVRLHADIDKEVRQTADPEAAVCVRRRGA